MSEGVFTIGSLRDVLVAPDFRPARLASVAQLLDNSRPGSGVLFTRTGAYFGVFASKMRPPYHRGKGVSI